MKKINLVLLLLLASVPVTMAQIDVLLANKEKRGLVDCSARFNSLSGQIEVRHETNPNGWQPANPDMVLFVNDHIRTRSESYAIVSYADLITFTIKKETEIVLNPLPGKSNKLKLVNGKIMACVKTMDDATMEIDINNAVVSIKEGTFSLESTASASILKVIEGTVIFRSKTNGKSVLLGIGKMIRADSSEVSIPAQVDLMVDKLEWTHYKTIAAKNPVKLYQKTAAPNAISKDIKFSIPVMWYLIPVLIIVLSIATLLIIRRRKKSIPVSSPAPQVTPSVNHKLCQQCGSPIQEGTKFCSKCGASIGQEVQQPEPLIVTTPVCISCGSGISPGMKFCMACGTPVAINHPDLPLSQAMPGTVPFSSQSADNQHYNP